MRLAITHVRAMGTLICCWNGRFCTILLENSLAFHYLLNIRILYDLAIPLLDGYSTKIHLHVHLDICKNVHTNLFTIAPNCK